MAAVAVLAACSKAAPAPEPVRAVRTQTIAADSAGATHEYAAEVRARVESRLGFRVAGKVARRNVDLGDAVKAGQVLAQIDPQDLRLGQESAQAALAAAQANFVQARADFQRYQELRAQGFIGAAELERRETTLKSAQATLDQAKAQAAVQGNQAAYSALVADAPGVITAVEAEPGQVVAAGTPIVRLAHDGPRDVVFSVPEDKQALVRPLEGKPGALRVRLWGSDTVLPATVREVAAAADATTRTFLVKADLGRVDVKLGQTATVLLDAPRVDGVIKLPLAAVFEHQGQSAVWRLDPQQMTVQPQPVKVVGAEGNLALVAAGIAPGQEIVTAGVHVLTPGQPVKRYGVAAAGPAAAASAH
ncbi:efflux RND transporter periplasmic adaptor subunit [Caldimonas sp. KR1-144]|uniref:efflux RND transporter periplasmic adaptor subunit n=1 Tax=Caldimonas sp. KR1-144 TaxID=3400911 RepID=UPI003BFE12D2